MRRLRHYEYRRFLRGDVIAGVTVTAYLVPQVLAYSTLAGMPPQSGLWAITVTLAVYAVLGTSRLLSLGPESTTALLTAATLGPLAVAETARYWSLAATLALLVGLVGLVARVLRLGFVADLLSKPVLTGYMAGVAVIMIASQLGKVCGVAVSGDTFVDEMSSFIENLSKNGVHVPTLILGISVTVVLVVFGGRFPRVPMPLVAVVGATLVVAVFGLKDVGIKVIGAIPQELPNITMPALSMSDVQSLLFPAVGIVIVGYADVILTGRMFAARHDEHLDNNQELVALSAANVGVSVVGGFPISTSGSRSVIAEATGARTQMYSIVAIVCVFLVVLFLGGPIGSFPVAALGGLVIYAALRLVDVSEFRRLWSFRRREFLLAFGATAGVLVFDILYGVLIAIALSVAELLVRVARPHEAVLGQVPGLPGWHDVDDYSDARQTPGLVVFRYDSPLFFANAEDFVEKCSAALDSADVPARWFLLNAEANVEVDITGLDAMEKVRAMCERRGIVFAVTRVKNDLRILLDRHGIAKRIGEDRIFLTLPTAADAYRAWLAEHPDP